MTMEKVLSRIQALLILLFVTLITFACNNSQSVSTPILVNESPVIRETPLALNQKPTEVTDTPGKVFSTVNPCNPDVVFQSDNVRWAKWIPFSDEIYYGMDNKTEYFSYSVSKDNVHDVNGTFEKYYARLVSQFGIDPSLTNQISPDHQQIVYSDVVPATLSVDSEQEHQIKEYISRIYLKNMDQIEVFAGDLVGIVYSFHWSSDNENVAIVMSTYSASSRERGVIYLLNNVSSG